MSNVRTVSFFWLSLSQEGLVLGGACLLARVYPRVCIFLPKVVSSVPCENSLSVLKIEDPEVRSNEMKELGGPFTLVVKISFCLIYCEWHFPQLIFSPRFKLLPSMKVSRDLVYFLYSYRLKPNESVPVPSVETVPSHIILPPQ